MIEGMVNAPSPASVSLPASRKRMNGLQLLRAIACVSIIAAHCVAYANFSYNIPVVKLDYPFRYSMLNSAKLFLGNL